MAQREGFNGAVKGRIKTEIRKRELEIASGTSKLIRESEEVDKLASFGSSSGDHTAAEASFVPDYAGCHPRQLETEITLLRNALKRVDAGTYGICSECGEPILLKRLDTVPWADSCTPCLGEKEAKARRLIRKGFDPTRQRYALMRV